MFQTDPVRGHFEYSEFFHLPWLWNGTLTNVLMVGLGGASTQRSYAHYYPQVTVETAELDPAVQRVAREYFGLREGARQIVHLEDGRTFLRRGRETYGAILMDAYTANRYGAYVPYHLVTREFFKLAADRLTTNGVLCYNMIGTVAGAQSDLMGSVYRTLAAVFPQVYIFPARESANVVLIATRSPERWTPVALHARGRQLAQAGQVRLPAFAARIAALQPQAPAAYAQALVLEDDFAPTDGMLRVFSAAGLQPAPTTAP
jgi:spermidine synthase